MILVSLFIAPACASSSEASNFKATMDVQQNSCAICLTDDDQCDFPAPCGRHLFHYDCLFEWLQRNHACPICRHAPNAAGHLHYSVFERPIESGNDRESQSRLIPTQSPNDGEYRIRTIVENSFEIEQSEIVESDPYRENESSHQSRLMQIQHSNGVRQRIRRVVEEAWVRDPNLTILQDITMREANTMRENDPYRENESANQFSFLSTEIPMNEYDMAFHDPYRGI